MAGRLFGRVLFLLLLLWCGVLRSAVIQGQLKKWHRVTFLFEGVNTSEGDATNPFTDYRLIVTFTKGSKSYIVHGHYAADGNAANTGADSGNKWRAYFSPDETGTWSYSVSFRTGSNINLDDNLSSGTAVSPLDGETGSFTIAASDKTGDDFRAKGRLNYVGEHYLQFAETGEYYIKGGTDSPENFLAYFEFDSTKDMSNPPHPASLNSSNGLHTYAPHVSDWNPGDPLWQSGKGKGIIGALNYLASKGVNSLYFITYNLDGGDGKDTWMWTTSTERWRYDVSKLDQWEIVFAHMDSLGIQMHLLTQETENDGSLGGNGNLNNIRKLYYKELISRYAHHLAVLWNMGEENTNTDAQRASFAQYFHEHDPYDHPVTVHNWNNTAYTFYDGILSNPSYLQYFEVTSLQGDGNKYFRWADSLRKDSEAAGRKWVICGDEQTPDVLYNLSNLSTLRKNTLWGNLMGGGGGVEWYFGYQDSYGFGDLQSEDFSGIATLWEQTKYALDFFHTHLPFHEMTPDSSLFTATNGFNYPGGYCFYKAGEVYAIYIKPGFTNVTVTLNIGTSGDYSVKWFNPRTGGALIDGTVTTVSGGGVVSLGKNPVNDNNDWVVLVKKITNVSITSTTWTGSVNSNWFNASNWTDGVPADSIDAVIPNVSPNSFPVIQGTAGTVAEADDVTIQAGAQLTISNVNNVKLVIHGNLSNSGQILGTGRLTFNGTLHTLNSPLSFSGKLEVQSGTLTTNGNLTLEDGASLLHGTGTPNGGGSVSGTIKMRRNANTNPLAYSYWASPVAGASVSLLGNSLYYYITSNATDNTMAGLKRGWAAASGTMNDAQGYIGRGNSVVEFNGTPHNGDYKIAVTRNAATGVGWNLIGNPYPSSVDAAAFIAENGPSGRNIITGSIYLWDDDHSNGSGWTSQDYAVWSGAGSISGPNSGNTFQGHIASCQGFFVEKIANGTDTILFTNSMRSSTNNNFFRQAPIGRLWLSAVSPAGDYNETLIAFMEDATDDADLLYDARKMKVNDKIALYSKIQNDDYAIQAVPLLDDDKTITVGMDAGTTGVYTLRLKTVENIDESVCIYLEDMENGIVHNFRLNPVYTFTANAGISGSRFILHFTAPLGLSSAGETCAQGDGQLTIIQKGTKRWDYTLTAFSGDVAASQSDFSGSITITGLTPGKYFLNLTDSSGYRVTKTVIISDMTPVIAGYALSESVYENEPVNFSNQTSGALYYEWDFGDGTTSMEENPVHQFAEAGIYEVTLLAANDDCSGSVSKAIQVLKHEPAFTVSHREESTVKIYGRGSEVLLEFGSITSQTARVEVFSTIGEKVYGADVKPESQHRIDLHESPAGCYLIRVSVHPNCYVKKVITYRKF